jgi:hypothetical protein
MHDSQLLESVAESLYGPQWIGDLARDICVSDRSIRRWVSGSDKVPWGVFHDVLRLVERRLASMDELQRILSERVIIRVAEDVKIPSYDSKTHWYFEVHDPESGRHSCIKYDVFETLTEVRSEMKRHPGMMFRVRCPESMPQEERAEFEKMNIRRMF